MRAPTTTPPPRGGRACDTQPGGWAGLNPNPNIVPPGLGVTGPTSIGSRKIVLTSRSNLIGPRRPH
eukprot:361526-Chlamydomonas_euryale.AAC.2